MPAPEFSGWNILDDDEDEEVQQQVGLLFCSQRYSSMRAYAHILWLKFAQHYGGTKDTVLFCIDASESMQTLHDVENDEGETMSKSSLHGALEAALAVSKSKIVSGPSDLIGIMLFNTVRWMQCARGDRLLRG